MTRDHGKTAPPGASPFAPPRWQIAAYIRLSREDGRDESLSVANQRSIILEYLHDHFPDGEAAVTDFYIDDGRSGTTEETRPEFQRMLADIDRGHVNCVICKTLSRCFRNYSDQGRFLEQFLPARHCRFIAISNPFVDTFQNPECMQNMEIPINGLMNDRYAAKTSADVRRTFHTKRRRGEFIGSSAPYGYRKDPENKNHLLIDAEAACVIRDIYQKFVCTGMGKAGIARYLNSLGVPNPTAYKRAKGIPYANPAAEENDGLWSAKTIRDILTNPVYTGTMVQGRQAIVSYKVHKRITAAPEDWYIVEGTHEAIISRQLFDAAQSLNHRNTRTAPGRQQVHLFSGFLRCADCRKAMIRCPSKNHVYYVCRTYREKSREACTRHSVRHDALEQAVLTAIRLLISRIPSAAELAAILPSSPAAPSGVRWLTELARGKEQELNRTLSLLDGLYPDMKSGDISRAQYFRMKARFEAQAQQLQQEIEALRWEHAAQSEPPAADQYLTTFLTEGTIHSLERGLLTELVEHIYVQEGGGIEIVFRCSAPLQAAAPPPEVVHMPRRR